MKSFEIGLLREWNRHFFSQSFPSQNSCKKILTQQFDCKTKFRFSPQLTVNGKPTFHESKLMRKVEKRETSTRRKEKKINDEKS